MMRGGKYWARSEMYATAPSGEEIHRSFLRGSFESPEDARQTADEVALRTKQMIEKGEEPIDWYLYGDRSKPEPLLEEVMSSDNQRIAIITVNAYGACILNTTDVAFVDVDLEPPRKNPLGFLAKLLGKKPPPPIDLSVQAIDKLRTHCRANPSQGARVYKTAAGLRYLLTGSTLDPTSDETKQLFNALGADPQYTHLCKAQHCFRARLTPKPGRMRVGWPPRKIRADREPTPELAQWEKTYAEESPNYATCELIETLGPPAQHPDIVQIQQLHDQLSGIESQLPLA